MRIVVKFLLGRQDPKDGRLVCGTTGSSNIEVRKHDRLGQDCWAEVNTPPAAAVRILERALNRLAESPAEILARTDHDLLEVSIGTVEAL
jgi:hypothetical protein